MARMFAALLRHAAYVQPIGVPSAHLPHPLTSEGELQARRAGEELARAARSEGWEVDYIIDSSRMLRAWQTAKLMSEVLVRQFHKSYVVMEYEALAERSVGAMANLTMEQIEETLRRDPRSEAPPPNWKRLNHYKLPVQGAESLEEAGARCAQHLESRLRTLAADVRDDTVKVFVGHGGAFRLAAAKLGVLAYDETAELSMFHCRPVFLQRHGDGSWSHVAGEWKQRTAHAAEAPD